MPSGSIGTIRGTIEIDYDGAGIVRAVRDTDKLTKGSKVLDDRAKDVTKSFTRLVRTMFIVGAAANAVHGAVSTVAGVVSTLGPLVAAGVATLPGILVAGAATAIILKVALGGVGKALKDAGKDSATFNEAIKNLAPEAQAFARAWRASLPALTATRNVIQGAFFQGFASLLGVAVHQLVSLRAQAAGVAGALGGIVREIVATVTSGQNIERIRVILSGLNAFLLRIRGSFGPIISAFLNLASQASAFGGVVGGPVAGALARIAGFINRVDLGALFETARPIVQSLGTLLGSLGSIASSLFSVFTVDGASAAGMLGQLAARLAQFLNSAAGQSALQALGQALSAIGGATGQVFLALLNALAPAIVALAPGVAALANQFAGVLVPAIQALAPLLLQIAQFISNNTAVVGPAIAVIVGLAAAYRVVTAATNLWKAAEAIAQTLRLKSAATWLASNAAMLAHAVALGLVRVASLAARAASIAWTAVQWALNAALNANPIGLVVIAIAALVAAIIYAYRHSETFRNIVQAVWRGIQRVISAVVGWITGTAVPWLVGAWNAIKAGVMAAINFAIAYFRAWMSVVRAVINAIRAVISGGMAFVRGVVSAYMAAVRAVFSAVWSAIVAIVRGAIARVQAVIAGIRAVVGIIRNAFSNARNAAASVIGSLISLVASIPGRVAGAIGNLGGILYEKGRSLIRGFVDGIKSMIGSAVSSVSGMVGQLTRFLPGSPAKEGPLSGRGYVLYRARRFMADLARGITSARQRPVRALAGVMRPVGAVVSSGGSTGGSGGSTPPPPPPPPAPFGPYVIQLGDKQFAELVIDAVTGQPKVIAGVAREGDRQTAWTKKR